jgi:hypothetical protein
MKSTLKHINWSQRIDKEKSIMLKNILSILLHESMNNNNNNNKPLLHIKIVH